MARSKSDKKTIAFLERMEMDNPEPDWSCPAEYPDLTQYKTIAVDLETRDPNLTTMGPGWPRKDGFIVGIAVAAGIGLGTSLSVMSTVRIWIQSLLSSGSRNRWQRHTSTSYFTTPRMMSVGCWQRGSRCKDGSSIRWWLRLSWTRTGFRIA